jgi:hypothetical protein
VAKLDENILLLDLIDLSNEDLRLVLFQSKRRVTMPRFFALLLVSIRFDQMDRDRTHESSAGVYQRKRQATIPKASSLLLVSDLVSLTGYQMSYLPTAVALGNGTLETVPKTTMILEVGLNFGFTILEILGKAARTEADERWVVARSKRRTQGKEDVGFGRVLAAMLAEEAFGIDLDEARGAMLDFVVREGLEAAARDTGPDVIEVGAVLRKTRKMSLTFMELDNIHLCMNDAVGAEGVGTALAVGAMLSILRVPLRQKGLLVAAFAAGDLGLLQVIEMSWRSPALEAEHVVRAMGRRDTARTGGIHAEFIGLKFVLRLRHHFGAAG